MKTKLLLLSLLASLTISAAEPIRWQYRIVSLTPDGAEYQLQNLGWNHWELAAESRRGLIFKRPAGNYRDEVDLTSWLDHAAEVKRKEFGRSTPFNFWLDERRPLIFVYESDFKRPQFAPVFQSLLCCGVTNIGVYEAMGASDTSTNLLGEIKARVN